MNEINRMKPLALAISLVLTATDENALAGYGQWNLSGPFEFAVSEWDEAQVTIMEEGWEQEVPNPDFFAHDDPFAVADLWDVAVTVLVAYGGGYGASVPCQSQGGVRKLTVTPPKGGKIQGEGINCGKSVPKDSYGGRVCKIKTCKGYGTEVNLQAIPDEGYEFVKWKQACKTQGQAPDCSVTIDKNRKVRAKFRRTP
jgi:hypothetical protein